MSEDTYSGNVSKTLLDPKVKILDFLNNEKKLDLNLSKTLIKVILKEKEENVFDKDFRKLMILILGTTFATKRIDTLISVDLATDPSMDLFESVLRFLKLSFETLPGLAYDIFYARVENLHLLSRTLFETDLSSETLSELDELRMLAVGSCPFRYDCKENTLIDSLQPPDNFREMSIFPTRLDLLTNESRDVFLRENKYHGAYKSVDHYLDVQFRLMREDFIRPLRDGVHEYRSKIGQSFNVRVYRNVNVLDAMPDRKMGIVHKLQLDQSRLTKINWSESKRFMNGALLCLSYDEFENFTFAVVAKRPSEEISQGILTVKFIDTVPFDYRSYTLLESMNLFENYRHVLVQLQRMNEESFCMKDYFVYGKKTISVPKYLSEDRKFVFSYKEQIMRLGSGKDAWPDAVKLQMNESQYEAFKSALTNEITIIQGPPGTGKTYIGLEICRCLLANVQTNLTDFGPILVVCYTNHALDQFLSGILQFTSNIVRIGGGSKSDSINTHSIHELKRRNWLDELRFHPIIPELQALEAELEFRRNAFQSLINLSRLQQIIPKEFYQYFVSVRIDKWLKGECLEQDEFGSDAYANWWLETIINEELRRHIKRIVVEACQEPIVNFKLYPESGSDSDDQYVLSFDYGYTRVKNTTTKNLFKSNLKKQNKMSPKEAKNVPSLDDLSLNNRWRLFRYWRSLYVASLKENSKEKEEEYDELCKRYNELTLAEHEKIMKQQDIIGMTTTGAAKYSGILERIGCKIIIVEEAAEVIESHVIAALNSMCQHLILIGDHKQLRPNPAVYELAKKYCLDLSLFERLINNDLAYSTLSTQHRMRPEISTIMRFIYPDLRDDDSVCHYPPVPAVRSNIFFFNHFEREQFCEDIYSYSNQFEAEFVLKFCRHLMGNGVSGERITILTLYSGQHYLINSLIDKTLFEGVRVSVVDNYQGEENDIILLSLVRSNEYEQIGFLNIENRICVSLSRAKHGLFVFGNFDILVAKNAMWRQICGFLAGKQLLAKSLSLCCQNHPTKTLTVRVATDFENYPDYGCEELCGGMLRCGHTCPRYCHFLDRRHAEYTCVADCAATCVNGHPCLQRCHERCGPCVVKITKTIPLCGHIKSMPCHMEPRKEHCTHPCQKVLRCGHVCTKLCGEECSPCLTKVTRISPGCCHSGDYHCYLSTIDCNRLCDFVLKCGHLCKSTCARCATTKSHDTCTQECGDLLICGHLSRAKYTSLMFPCTVDVIDECVHTATRIRCDKQCAGCTEPCQWKCRHAKCTARCVDACDMTPCNQACKKTLCCTRCEKEFKCYGVCGEKCRQICTNCDPAILPNGVCYITLWSCGHTFELTIMDQYMFEPFINGVIERKTCPTCGKIINKRSCFRYMNVVKEISKSVETVQKCITKKIDSLEYSSYYRLLHSVKASMFVLFTHYNVVNYFRYNDTSQDVLYTVYFDSIDSQKYDLVYRFRCAVILLYKVYANIYVRVRSLDSLTDRSYATTARLVEWLNPEKRKFNDSDMDTFIGEYKNIVKLKGDIKTRRKEEVIVNFTEEKVALDIVGEQVEEKVINRMEIEKSEDEKANIQKNKEEEIKCLETIGGNEDSGSGEEEVMVNLTEEAGAMEIVEEQVEENVMKRMDIEKSVEEEEDVEKNEEEEIKYLETIMVNEDSGPGKEEVMDNFMEEIGAVEIVEEQVEENVMKRMDIEKSVEEEEDVEKNEEEEIKYLETIMVNEDSGPGKEEVMDNFMEEIGAVEIVEEQVEENVIKIMKIEKSEDEKEDVEKNKEEICKNVTTYKMQIYMRDIFMEGYTTMRAFNSADRQWFKCVKGHVYNNGESLHSPPQCPYCYPNILWPITS